MLKHEEMLELVGAVVNAGLEVCGERLLNISVGTVFCPQHGTEAESLLAEADRDMYRVKQQHKSAELTTLSGKLSAENQPQPTPIV